MSVLCFLLGATVYVAEATDVDTVGSVSFSIIGNVYNF